VLKRRLSDVAFKALMTDAHQAALYDDAFAAA
jgi:hypothetical protein